jgi:hypothetical protein
MLISGQGHPRSVLYACTRHYNGHRPHQSRHQRPPECDEPATMPPGALARRATVPGGVINETTGPPESPNEPAGQPQRGRFGAVHARCQPTRWMRRAMRPAHWLAEAQVRCWCGQRHLRPVPGSQISARYRRPWDHTISSRDGPVTVAARRWEAQARPGRRQARRGRLPSGTAGHHRSPPPRTLPARLAACPSPASAPVTPEIQYQVRIVPRGVPPSRAPSHRAPPLQARNGRSTPRPKRIRDRPQGENSAGRDLAG